MHRTHLQSARARKEEPQCCGLLLSTLQRYGERPVWLTGDVRLCFALHRAEEAHDLRPKRGGRAARLYQEEAGKGAVQTLFTESRGGPLTRPAARRRRTPHAPVSAPLSGARRLAREESRSEGHRPAHSPDSASASTDQPQARSRSGQRRPRAQRPHASPAGTSRTPQKQITNTAEVSRGRARHTWQVLPTERSAVAGFRWYRSRR